jgi:hypothetical protein
VQSFKDVFLKDIGYEEKDDVESHTNDPAERVEVSIAQ